MEFTKEVEILMDLVDLNSTNEETTDLPARRDPYGSRGSKYIEKLLNPM